MENVLNRMRAVNRMFPQLLGERHDVDGREMILCVDGDAFGKMSDLTGVGQYGNHGMSESTITYYAVAEDFDKIPKTGDMQRYDGRMCVVDDVRDDAGMLRVTLSQRRG